MLAYKSWWYTAGYDDQIRVIHFKQTTGFGEKAVLIFDIAFFVDKIYTHIMHYSEVLFFPFVLNQPKVRTHMKKVRYEQL